MSPPSVVDCSAPVRIDLSGGIVDVAPAVSDLGATVVNASINLRVSVRAVRTSYPGVVFGDGQPPLLGGRALSVALGRTHPELGMHANVIADVPSGAGLGTSGATCVAMVGAAKRLLYEAEDDPLVLAEEAFVLERSMGVLGGSQDQIAAAFGGLNCVHYRQGGIEVERLGSGVDSWNQLLAWSVLLKPPGTRQSGGVIRRVMSAYSLGAQDVRQALSSLSHVARDIAQVLRESRYEDLGPLLDTTRALQCRLHSSIVGPGNSSLMNGLRQVGALGGKILGAGGEGSCIFVLCPPDARACVVRKARELGVAELPFSFSDEGFSATSAAPARGRL